MGWMNLNDYLVTEAAAAARRQDLMNAGRRFPESQSWVTVVVLAVSALVIGSGGCASSETTPGASRRRLRSPRLPGVDVRRALDAMGRRLRLRPGPAGSSDG